MTRLLILGSEGQLGRELIQVFSQGFEVFTSSRKPSSSPNHHPLDLEDDHAIRSLMTRLQPHWVINAAAYTAVDKAENEQQTAMQVNAHAVATIASILKSMDAGLIHYSTDYVYDGKGDHSRSESEATNPINQYGKSKLQGECFIRTSDVKHLIFRTSWVFSSHGNNFVKTMMRLGQERQILKVVNDQVGSPTSARMIAQCTRLALDSVLRGYQVGLNDTYHLCCEGTTSWFGFAAKIFDQMRIRGMSLKVEELIAITSEEFPTPATRPQNSRLCCDKFKQQFQATLPDWQKELELVLGELI